MLAFPAEPGHGAAAMTQAADPIMNAAPPSPETGRSEVAASMSIALPLALTNLGNIAINTTDVVMVGWLGAEALAAGMLGFTLIFLFLLGGIGLTSSVPALTAQAHGSGDARAVRRTIRQGLWASVLYSAPAIAVLMHGEWILLMLGQDPTASRLAGEYLAYAAWSLPFILGVMVLRALLATLDRAAVIVWITGSGIILNAAINYGLIFGNWGLPRLEIVGAGVATTATSAVGFTIIAIYVVTHPAIRGYHVFRRLWIADFERLKAIVRLGAPIALTALLEEGLFAASTLMVGWLGPLTLAGHTIALQCTAVAFMIPLGISQAGTVRVGIAAGPAVNARLLSPGLGATKGMMHEYYRARAALGTRDRRSYLAGRTRTGGLSIYAGVCRVGHTGCSADHAAARGPLRISGPCARDLPWPAWLAR